jgi:polyhydroxyalkanoate synthase
MATRAAGQRFVDPQRWRAETPLSEGSWWPAWQQWLAQRSTGRVPPPAPRSVHDAYAPLDDAPGTYVKMR